MIDGGRYYPIFLNQAGKQPIHHACEMAYLATVQLLLNYGVDPTIPTTDEVGNRPIHFAAGGGVVACSKERRKELMAYLIETCKIDVNSTNNV